MRIAAIIQARTGSSRMPGKVLKKICNKTVLGHVIDRVIASKAFNEIIVATTDCKQDDEIALEAQRNGALVFRGSESNVLERYYFAARKYNVDIIVRITSDCPLIDPDIISKLINIFKELHQKGDIDYLSNCLTRTFPRGLDIEIFTIQALKNAHDGATKVFELEHVTPYIYQHPEIFTIKNYENNIDLSNYRWTLDTPEDFEFISEVYSALYSPDRIFKTEDILKLLDEKSELIDINAHIEQKTLF